jgi:thioredoxin:protein disulfide reductase
MQYARNWIPAFAGMTALLCSGVAAAGDLLGKKKPEFLPVDLAFELQPPVWKDDGTLEVSWRIAKDYYLYRDRLKITAAAPFKLGKPVLPASLPYEDEHFGTTQVYRDKLVVKVPIETTPYSPEGKGISVTVVYQGCADAGLCYPPQTRTLETGN